MVGGIAKSLLKFLFDMSKKYPRGEIVFHAKELLENLEAFHDVLEDSNLELEKLSFNDTFSELKELIARITAAKPNGNGINPNEWSWACPRCPCCGARIRSGNGSSSNVRDNCCRKCGQHIDWTAVVNNTL